MNLRPAILASAFLLGACEAGIGSGPRQSIDPNRDFNAIIINNTLAPERLAAFAQLSIVPTGSRNAIIEARMAEIDVLYFEYERALSAQVRQGNFLTNFAAVLIGAAGSQASGATSQGLSALGGVIAGGGAAYQKEVLLEQSVQAFLSQMRANRNVVKGDILRNMTLPATAYTLQSALSDLARYEQAGTLATAVSGITLTAQVREAASVRDLTTAEVLTAPERTEAASNRQPLNATLDSAALNQRVASDPTTLNSRAQACFDEATVPKPATLDDFIFDPGDWIELGQFLNTCTAG